MESITLDRARPSVKKAWDLNTLPKERTDQASDHGHHPTDRSAPHVHQCTVPELCAHGYRHETRQCATTVVAKQRTQSRAGEQAHRYSCGSESQSSFVSTTEPQPLKNADRELHSQCNDTSHCCYTLLHTKHLTVQRTTSSRIHVACSSPGLDSRLWVKMVFTISESHILDRSLTFREHLHVGSWLAATQQPISPLKRLTDKDSQP
jgi:hypothetical protein